MILNFVASVNNTGTFIAAVTTGTMKTAVTVIGCIADGNGSGNGHNPFRVLETSTGDCSIYAFNNTFYDFDGEGCMMQGGHVYFRNNIFLLSSGAEAFHYVSTGGSVDEDYNCWYTSGGAISPWVADDVGVNCPPVAGEHVLQADPDFVDAANGDFRVRNPIVLRGGRPGPDGKASVIGAIGQEYRFAERGRMMNPGRMTILR